MRGRRKFAQPTTSQVHLNTYLSNVSVAYTLQAEGFISTKVFPVIPVDHQSDKYRTYNRNDWMRDEMEIRPPATESAGSGWTMGEDTYYAQVWALHKDVDNQTEANADPSIDLARDSTVFLTQKAMIRQERAFINEMFVTGVWANETTPTDLWSDYSFSTPIANVEAAKRQILATTGYMPNTIVAGYDVFVALASHPDIIDRYKYTSAETVTPDLLARLFGVQNFYVSSGVYASNVEGETAAYSFAMGKHMWLGYVAPNPGLLQPSAGYTFMWRGVSGGLGLTAGVSNFYMPEVKATRYEIEIAFDDKVVASDLGYLFLNAVS